MLNAMPIPEAVPDMSALRRSVLSVAGASYLAAWVVGLLVFSSSTQVRSTGAQVLRSYTGHSGALTMQFILTEGVTGIGLAVVLGHLAAGIVGRLGEVVRISGLTAATISVGQCGIGVFLATALLSRHDSVAAEQAFDILNRLDGAKMLLLAVSAGATAAAVRHARIPLPSWLKAVGVGTSATIAISGAGYLALDSTLATAAYVSLPLLIAFVTGTSVCLVRQTDTSIGLGGVRRLSREGRLVVSGDGTDEDVRHSGPLAPDQRG
jgi:hypothetical protein